MSHLNPGVEIHHDSEVQDYALIYTNTVVRSLAVVGANGPISQYSYHQQRSAKLRMTGLWRTAVPFYKEIKRRGCRSMNILVTGAAGFVGKIWWKI